MAGVSVATVSRVFNDSTLVREATRDRVRGVAKRLNYWPNGVARSLITNRTHAIGVLMPGEQGYVGWKLVVRGREIPYGLFLGELVNFLIVALAVFVFIVKFLGWATKAKQEPVAAPAPPTRDQALLAEIRDLLKRPSG